jgi:hypothetical protein
MLKSGRVFLVLHHVSLDHPQPEGKH